MILHYKSKIYSYLFNHSINKILLTPPVKLSPESDLVLLTMLGKRSLKMYLLAAKSLLRYLPDACALVVLDDGTLSTRYRKILEHHFPGIVFYYINDVKTGSYPKGGCWERLTLVAQLVQQKYVVQFDSDTLTMDYIPEVVECIQAKRSFVLGTEENQSIVSAKEAEKRWRGSNNTHVQALAEKSLCKLAAKDACKYTRGNAGFSGYAPGSFNKLTIERFSSALEDLLGVAKWQEWGSEQVTSNLVLANSLECAILPFPKYAPYEPTPLQPFSNSVFLHFYGTFRYANRHYFSSAKRVLHKLLSNSV